MPRQEVTDAITQAILDLNDPNADKVKGTEIFESIESDTRFSAQEKQEIHKTLGKDIMTKSLASSGNDPTTLMRLDSPGTNFIGAYMTEYAREYNDAVRHSAIHEVVRTVVPQSLKGATFGSGVGSDITLSNGQPASKEDRRKFDEATQDLTSRIIQSTEQHLSELSTEAREFMEATLEPVVQANNVKGFNRATASVLVLRNVNAKITADSNAMKQDKNLQLEGNLLSYASIVMGTYYNNVNGEKTVVSKAQDQMALDLRKDDARLKQTENAFIAVGAGGHAIDVFQNQVGTPTLYNNDKSQQTTVSQMQVSALKGSENVLQKAVKRDVANAEAALGDSLDKVGKLQARLKRLDTKPSFGDHVKAFFTHGGMDKLRSDTHAEIATTAKDIGQILQQNKKIDLDKFLEKNERRLELLKGVSDNLSQPMLDYVLAQDRKDMSMEKLASKEFMKNEGKVAKVEARVQTGKSVRAALNQANTHAPTASTTTTLGQTTKVQNVAQDTTVQGNTLPPSTTTSTPTQGQNAGSNNQTNVSGINGLAKGKFDAPKGTTTTTTVSDASNMPTDINDLAKGNLNTTKQAQGQKPQLHKPNVGEITHLTKGGHQDLTATHHSNKVD